MLIKVKLNNFKTAPRKVRLVADLVRGKNVEEAQIILEFVLKESAKPIKKLLDSAVASVKRNEKQLDVKSLYISEILVNEGRVLKRWRASSRGRSSRILKRSSHIILTLSKIKEKKSISSVSALEKKKKVETKKEKIKKVSKSLSNHDS